MCDYCGCRTRPLLDQLGADHARITGVAARLRHHVGAGDRAGAGAALSELAGLLGPHSSLEERSLYVELEAAGVDGAGLHDDHRLVDDTVRRAADGEEDAWSELPAVLDVLAAHIRREEYDLFPAAHQLLDDQAWDRLDAARRAPR